MCLAALQRRKNIRLKINVPFSTIYALLSVDYWHIHAPMCIKI